MLWSKAEHIYVRGRVDRHYVPDPSSTRILTQFAALTHGRVFGENDMRQLGQTIHDRAGSTPAHTEVLGYARIALAPWILLAGVIPLGFLLWRRNA